MIAIVNGYHYMEVTRITFRVRNNSQDVEVYIECVSAIGPRTVVVSVELPRLNDVEIQEDE